MCQARTRVGPSAFRKGAHQSFNAARLERVSPESPPGGEVGLGTCAPGARLDRRSALFRGIRPLTPLFIPDPLY